MPHDFATFYTFFPLPYLRTMDRSDLEDLVVNACVGDPLFAIYQGNPADVRPCIVVRVDRHADFERERIKVRFDDDCGTCTVEILGLKAVTATRPRVSWGDMEGAQEWLNENKWKGCVMVGSVPWC